MMTLEQIRTLCCIIECGTLKKAADNLHKTQPALSMAIRKLEDEYGFQILARDNYRLTLTEAGKSFYYKAQELLQSSEQLNSLGKHLGIGHEANIRLGYDAICPISDMLDILKSCQEKFPYTEIDLIGETRFGALDLLKKREVDLAISPWWPSFYALGDLESLPISHFKVIMVAAPQIFGEKQNVAISDLKQHVHISIEESDLSFDTRDLVLLKGCRQWRTRDAYTLKSLLVEGLGWGYVPEFMVEQEIKNGQLARLIPDNLEHVISGEIRIVKRQEYTLGPVSSMIWNSFS